MAKVQRLYTRVKIIHINGAEFGYHYNKESLDSLELKRDTYEGARFFEIGNKIAVGETKYEIKNIVFKIETDYFDFYGANPESEEDQSNFNSTINIFIDDIPETE